MEALHSLLFELAGEDRLNIILELRNKPLRLTDLAKKLNSTVQEASRNIARLTEAKLITKEIDGSYRLTPYGEETLDLTSGMNFLSKHRDYFVTHSLSTIPKEFALGIASLNNSELVEDVMVAFSNVESMIQKAEQYMWILSDQVLVSTLSHLMEALKRGVEFNLILPKTVIPPKDALERMNDIIFFQASKTGKFENRFLDKVDVLICLSEREVAALGFSSINGKLDYHGFCATDGSSLKWTKDLYSYYWKMATPQKPWYSTRK